MHKVNLLHGQAVVFKDGKPNVDPEGNYIIEGGDELRSWDANKGEFVTTLPDFGIQEVEWTMDEWIEYVKTIPLISKVTKVKLSKFKRIEEEQENTQKVIDWCKEPPNLTRNEKEALGVLVNMCFDYPELRHVMTMVRGTKPEQIVKKYFRANPQEDDITFKTKDEKGAGE